MYFPHIYRVFPARFVAVAGKAAILVCMLLFLLSSIVVVLYPKDSLFERTRFAVLSSPYNPVSHINLSNLLIKHGLITSAEDELLIADQLSSYNSHDLQIDLGQSRSILRIQKERPGKLTQALKKWQLFSNQLPSYRDAYIQMAWISYDLHQTEKAKMYLEKAYEIDPNFDILMKLQKLIDTAENEE